MLELSDVDRALLKAAVTRSLREAGAVQAVRDIYVAFERERAARQPKCDASGACCHFETHGHRLFVTTLELAAFVATRAKKQNDGWVGKGCQYQVNGLCGAREGRPFGCRVYFCDPTSTDWQQAQYERFHAQLRELHDRLGVPYLYAEWRNALAAIDPPEAPDDLAEVPVGKRRLVLTVLPAGR